MTQPEPEQQTNLSLEVVCAAFEQQIAELSRKVAILNAQLYAANNGKADDAG